MTKTVAVITTINEPTKAVKEFAKRIPLIVIGDEKTPKNWYCEGSSFYDHWIQRDTLPFSYQPPSNHYARKNVGYLLAMESGADCIYDTDDDNIPNENWKLREATCEAKGGERINGWYNVYNLFNNANIWPRGFSLQHLDGHVPISKSETVTSSIQQGLSDNESDVDAIWRMIMPNRNWFKVNKSVYLKPFTWCPFNSQTTWWFKKAFPLMYLPQYCSFRMTDIWRSFVAQRCLWEMGEGVTFHSPSEVYQERNEHNLLKDFEDEIPGYLNNDKIKEALDGLELGKDLRTNIVKCYGELITIGVIPFDELKPLEQWLTDIDKVWKP